MERRTVLLLMVSAFVWGGVADKEVGDYFRNQRHTHYAELAKSNDAHVSGCALAALLDEYSNSEYQDCLKRGKITGAILHNA